MLVISEARTLPDVSSAPEAQGEQRLYGKLSSKHMGQYGPAQNFADQVRYLVVAVMLGWCVGLSNEVGKMGLVSVKQMFEVSCSELM